MTAGVTDWTTEIFRPFSTWAEAFMSLAIDAFIAAPNFSFLANTLVKEK